MPSIGRGRTGKTVDGLERVTIENWKMPESFIN
jgi:hypothetical protein